MDATGQDVTESRHSVFEPATHSLYDCSSASEFSQRFEAATGCSVQSVADSVMPVGAPRAIFLVGSVALGMATAGSDIDFVVLVDSDITLIRERMSHIVNDDQGFAFANQSSSLVAGAFVALKRGIAVEVQVVSAPDVGRLLRQLRSRGPELSETEIMILGRIRTGWLLCESPEFLVRNVVNVADPALLIYCSTKHFASALIEIRKAEKVLDFGDLPLALSLGRMSVEMAYRAYLASEGYAYLGTKWLAQLGQARGASERIKRHPVLADELPLLFPEYRWTAAQVAQYLQAVTEFLAKMRTLIELKSVFRIAFHACPQIHDIQRRKNQ